MIDIPEPTEPDLETDPLYILVCRDNFRRLFAALNSTERLIAILRALTWTDEAIAEMLNIQPISVNKIIQRARRRLIQTLPIEAAGMLRGRRWLEPTRQPVQDPNADLSAYQAALILQVTTQRIKVLCRRGVFPNARRQESHPHTWVIPARDLNDHLPRQGRL